MSRIQIHSRRRGLTVLELLVVLAILVVVAGGVLSQFATVGSDAKEDTTEASLGRIRLAIIGGGTGPGYQADLGALPTTLADLLRKPSAAADFAPATARGWRGPYVLHNGGTYVIRLPQGFTSAYGAAGDPVLFDSWGSPVVLQYPAKSAPPDFTAEEKRTYVRLVSAGPDGVIDTPATKLKPADLTAALRDDDVVLFLNVADSP